jgi:hypothetical protein
MNGFKAIIGQERYFLQPKLNGRLTVFGGRRMMPVRPKERRQQQPIDFQSVAKLFRWKPLQAPQKRHCLGPNPR